jgi:hypothetical protein
MTPTQSVVDTMASAADPCDVVSWLVKELNVQGRHTPIAMVSIPILEHIELSLATAPFLPLGVEALEMTS